MLIWLLLFCLSTLSFAATESQQAELLAIDSAFINAHYEQVELLSLRLLQNEQSLTPQEAARVHVTTGYALIMLDRENEARDHFRKALDAEPELTLDPVQVSPKFRIVFDDVKADYQQKQKPPATVTPHNRGASRGALISNLFLPGSGQWQEDKKIRGAVFFAVQAATVGVLIWQISKTRQSREDYLAESDAGRISDAYDDYNNNYMLAWGAGALTAAVYLSAQIDLITMQKKQNGLTIYPSIGNVNGLTASLRF